MEWQKRGLDTVLLCGGLELGRILGQREYTDSLTPEGEGVWRWQRRGPATDRMRLSLRGAYAPDYTLVPAVNYDGNGWGTFCEYLGDRHHGEPWRYAWHRASVPGMTYSEGTLEGRACCLSLFGEAVGHNSMRLYAEDGGVQHTLEWPEEETPHTLRHYRYGPPYHGQGAAREAFTAWIVADTDFPARRGYHRALDAAWAQNRGQRPMPETPEALYDLGLDYARTLYTEEPDGFRGFNIGLAWEDGAWRKRRFNKYEIGWCGQNGMLANAFLYEAKRQGRPELAETGLQVLDSWIQKAHLPLGVLHSYYDPGQERYLEANNLGTAGLAYFEAADLAAELGLARPAYEQIALEICDFALAHQQPDGRFAKCWREDGQTAIAEGTVGAYLVLPLAEAHRRGLGDRYLDAAIRGFRYYEGELLRQGFTTAGALDILSIDKESAIPLLKAAITLHGATGDAAWVGSAREAAWYLSTWQTCYTMDYGPDAVLTHMGFDTHGGTIVSTVHQGMDPFALCYVPELLALWSATGEARWWERAQAIWRNGCQCISDGSLVVDGKKRPRGSQDESYAVTRQGPMGRPSEWLVAWPGAFRMETLRRLADAPYAEAFFTGKEAPK